MKDGVSTYIRTQIDIFFEPGHFGCAWCPLLETYSRNKCRMTAEYIVDTRVTGAWCPLEIKKEENDNRETGADSAEP